MITGRVGACGGCVQGAMRPSRKADLKYSFEWTEFEFYPAKCSSQKSRLPRVVITAPNDPESLIRFPTFGVATKKITLTAFPAASLNGERVFNWKTPLQMWRWPKTSERFPNGFFWMDFQFEGNPPYMGRLDQTKVKALDAVTDPFFPTGGSSPSANLLYMASLRDYARGEGDKDVLLTSPAHAFAAFTLQTPCPTSATRAYVVDWALAEQRTGLRFESMEAFEEWAAQQGLTVLGVVDAASESASASESEGEE